MLATIAVLFLIGSGCQCILVSTIQDVLQWRKKPGSGNQIYKMRTKWCTNTSVGYSLEFPVNWLLLSYFHASSALKQTS